MRVYIYICMMTKRRLNLRLQSSRLEVKHMLKKRKVRAEMSRFLSDSNPSILIDIVNLVLFFYQFVIGHFPTILQYFSVNL